jgi:hypothetical protein
VINQWCLVKSRNREGAVYKIASKFQSANPIYFPLKCISDEVSYDVYLCCVEVPQVCVGVSGVVVFNT